MSFDDTGDGDTGPGAVLAVCIGPPSAAGPAVASIAPGAVVNTWSPEGDGKPAAAEAAAVRFPFAAGWIGGALDTGTGELTGGNLPANAKAERIETGASEGEWVLTLPGLEAHRDGVLLVAGADGGDNIVGAAPLADGTGWQIRVADESHNFGTEEDGRAAFVFVPFAADVRAAGHIAEDGTLTASAGSLGVRKTGTGRYEIAIPGTTGDTGFVLASVAK
ncbi:MAG: hypothetical protein VKI81_11605, partial [Synechococcaceae cyanobacterium]|nr:hypothetical protein [Synechococcaceae cyanobacterium]